MIPESSNQEPAGRELVSDTRIVAYHGMPTPMEVISGLPNERAGLVSSARAAIRDVLSGADDRLLVVIGPCSIHDPVAAIKYAGQLVEYSRTVQDDLLVVMRVYFEKPRTSVGWKGLINDPGLDGSFDIRRGLSLARKLLLDIFALGLPCGTEFLDTVIPQYTNDTVAWGAIGARTTESQIHREMASGLSCPVGFKNGTDGNIKIAVDAISASNRPHHFLAVTPEGSCSIAETTGNEDTHIILRGGDGTPNYDDASVASASAMLEKAGLPARIMIDCSHANSGKDYRRQSAVAADVAGQVAAGDRRVIGVMVESNLVEGSQKLGGELVFGQSVTDSCLGWTDSVTLLDGLAKSTQARRKAA